MADWNASLYLTFEEERTRPARDLLARVPLDQVESAIDLGCGPGNSTELLAGRWPTASLLGIDTSEDMLASARSRLPAARFEKADVATFEAEAPPDLIFANAVLQWLGNHDRLIPRLMTMLAPGGVLAIQVPDNLDEPSHWLMRETATKGPWAATLGDAGKVRERIHSPGWYYDLLAPLGRSVDIWRTTYNHPLADPDAVVEWLRATGLRPFIEPLCDGDRAAFLAAYRTRIAEAYPPRTDGKVLLGFPRLFIVARR